jgi:hypothetical protein
MQTIAAYYIVIAIEMAREARQPKYRVVPTRPRRAARFVAAVTSLVRPARGVTSQPA